MKVILQNDIAIKPKLPLLLKEAPRIEDDLDRLRPRENRNPTDDRASQEVRILRFENPVTSASHGGVIGGNGVSMKGVPKRSLGTRMGPDGTMDLRDYSLAPILRMTSFPKSIPPSRSQTQFGNTVSRTSVAW